MGAASSTRCVSRGRAGRFAAQRGRRWTPVEEIGDLAVRLVVGEFDALSGRFIHVVFDHEAMLEETETIVEEGLYIPRLPGLDGLVD